ncbi:MAG: GNAT family N-acetyltransferase [Acidimicrobiia bacterium]
MPATPELLTTDRLTLTRFPRFPPGPDFDFVDRLWDDPDVAATLGGMRPTAERFIRAARLAGHWDEFGFGIWIMRTNTGPIGYCGLAHTDISGPGGVELLYAQLPAAWGNGYVTEAARAILDVAFDPVAGLGLGEVVAFTLPTNTASRSVMDRTGFVYAGDVEHAGLPHVLYRCAAART